MNLSMHQKSVFQSYKSNSQIARVLTESWFSSEMYCPCCLNSRLLNYPNNQKASDFLCGRCRNDFQLKSSRRPFSKKVLDGEYNTMVRVIQKGNPPSLFLLQRSAEWIVESLDMIPKFFFTLSILEKRKSLSEHARRSGWTGCSFLLNRLPKEGKIPIIQNERVQEKEKVNKIWRKMVFLANKKPEFRGWTSDVLKIVQELGGEFKLTDVYKHGKYFKELHPENNNVRAKIRQQLQILRDNRMIKFGKKGFYEVL